MTRARRPPPRKPTSPENRQEPARLQGRALCVPGSSGSASGDVPLTGGCQAYAGRALEVHKPSTCRLPNRRGNVDGHSPRHALEFAGDRRRRDLAVAAQVVESAAQVKEVDERQVPLGKVFGFKTITGSDERHVARFIALMEAETGLTGAESLVTFARDFYAKSQRADV